MAGWFPGLSCERHEPSGALRAGQRRGLASQDRRRLQSCWSGPLAGRRPQPQRGHRAAHGRYVTNYCSLVDTRCRLRMNSRTADWAYRTARPILMKRGPVPLSRDLASQDDDTASSLATCTGCSSGSISLFSAAALTPHLLFIAEDGPKMPPRLPQKERSVTPKGWATPLIPLQEY